MDAFCDYVEYVLKRGGHGRIFCSAVQSTSWWQRDCACMEEVNDGVAKTEVFEVEQALLFYSR